MLSKMLQPRCQHRLKVLLTDKINCPQLVKVRKAGDMIPPNQYDVPLPQRMMPGTAMRNNWEVIPLFAVTALAMSFVFGYIGMCFKHKVDVVFKTHSRDNISRTMDLRCPTVHKLIIINQRYEPWPEMQEVLDKMADAERQLLLRAATCSFVRN